jgi:hypothetical protein
LRSDPSTGEEQIRPFPRRSQFKIRVPPLDPRSNHPTLHASGRLLRTDD